MLGDSKKDIVYSREAQEAQRYKAKINDSAVFQSTESQKILMEDQMQPDKNVQIIVMGFKQRGSIHQRQVRTFLLEEDGGGEPDISIDHLGTQIESEPNNDSLMIARYQLRAQFAKSLLEDEQKPDMLALAEDSSLSNKYQPQMKLSPAVSPRSIY